MAATGPGLGAYIQAQKRQKQIEDQLAHANKDEGGKEGAKKEDGDKKDDKEELEHRFIDGQDSRTGGHRHREGSHDTRRPKREILSTWNM